MNLRKTICATILLGINLQCFAATIYWANTNSGLYNVATNWQGAIGPTNTSDSASINDGGTAIIDSTMTISNAIVQIGDTNGTTGTLQMTGGSLTQSSDLRAGGNATTGGGTGTFELDGGSVLLTGGNLNVGFGTTAHGTYNINGGSIQLNAASPIFAVGNRGVGTVNQTGGTVYLRNSTGLTQLGRNTGNVPAFGTYTLTGGTLATAKLQFGQVVQTNGVSANNFTLYGGTLIVNSISNLNTTANNTFTFGGFFTDQEHGTLLINTSGISIAHTSGLLVPAFADFSNAAGTNISSLPIDYVAKLSFLAGCSLNQNTGAVTSFTISGPASYSSIDIPTGGTAGLQGYININLANGYVPTLGTTFDVVTAPTISYNCIVTTTDGSAYSSAIVTGGDGRQVLRLTLTQLPVTPPTLSITSPSNGTVQINFSATANNAFDILASGDVTKMFNSIGTATEISPGNYQFIDLTTTQRFYRVQFP